MRENALAKPHTLWMAYMYLNAVISNEYSTQCGHELLILNYTYTRCYVKFHIYYGATHWCSSRKRCHSQLHFIPLPVYVNHERFISSSVCMLLLWYISFSYYMRYTLFHGINSKFIDTGRGRINSKRNKMLAIYKLLKPYLCTNTYFSRFRLIVYSRVDYRTWNAVM